MSELPLPATEDSVPSPTDLTPPSETSRASASANAPPALSASVIVPPPPQPSIVTEAVNEAITVHHVSTLYLSPFTDSAVASASPPVVEQLLRASSTSERDGEADSSTATGQSEISQQTDETQTTAGSDVDQTGPFAKSEESSAMRQSGVSAASSSSLTGAAATISLLQPTEEVNSFAVSVGKVDAKDSPANMRRRTVEDTSTAEENEDLDGVPATPAAVAAAVAAVRSVAGSSASSMSAPERNTTGFDSSDDTAVLHPKGEHAATNMSDAEVAPVDAPAVGGSPGNAAQRPSDRDEAPVVVTGAKTMSKVEEIGKASAFSRSQNEEGAANARLIGSPTVYFVGVEHSETAAVGAVEEEEEEESNEHEVRNDVERRADAVSTPPPIPSSTADGDAKRGEALQGTKVPSSKAATDKDEQPIALTSSSEDTHATSANAVGREVNAQPQQLPTPAKASGTARKRRRAPLAGPTRSQPQSATRVNTGASTSVALASSSAHATAFDDASSRSGRRSAGPPALNEYAEKSETSSTPKPPEGNVEATATLRKKPADEGDDAAEGLTRQRRVKTEVPVEASDCSVSAGPLPSNGRRQHIKSESSVRHADAAASAPLLESRVPAFSATTTTIAERAAAALTSHADDGDDGGTTAESAQKVDPRKRALSRSLPSTTPDGEPPVKATHSEAETTPNNRHADLVSAASAFSVAPSSATTAAATAPQPSSSPSAASPPAPPSPSFSSSSRPVFNIAGVNVQALLAESTDPPPLYLRRQRRTRRKSVLAEDHPIFAEHRDLSQHDQTRRVIARAPFASDADVLNSLVEWRDSPALVYARLLWRYTPRAFLHVAMYGLDASAPVKAEPTADSAKETVVKKEKEDE